MTLSISRKSMDKWVSNIFKKVRRTSLSLGLICNPVITA